MCLRQQAIFASAAAIFLGMNAFVGAQDLHVSYTPIELIPDRSPAIEIGSVSHTYVLGVLHTADDTASAVQIAPVPTPIQVSQDAQGQHRVDFSFYTFAMGSAATVFAIVALTRSKSAHITPVIHVHVPATDRIKTKKGIRNTKKASASSRDKAPHVYQNYDLGPSFEEERANEAQKEQQAEEALLMGLFESNMVMRSAIANLPPESDDIPFTESPVATTTECAIANDSSFGSSTTIPPADTTVTTS